MLRRLRLGLLALVLSTSRPAQAQSAPQGQQSGDGRWGWLVVAGSVAAGALVTTYGLTIDCGEFDHDCQRHAALPIWGGIGIAATGSLVGLYVVQVHSEPRATALYFRTTFY